MTHQEAVERIRAVGLQGAAHGNLKRVRELLELDHSLVDALNSIDREAVDETPQGAAAHTGSRKILEWFVEAGVHPDIFMAAALGDADRVRDMLKDNPKLINARGAHRIPLIAHAADAPTAQVMIDAGVPCDIFMAAQLGLADHIGKLVRRDPELLSLHSPAGLTALQIARMYQQKEAVRVLLNDGAQDPDSAGAYFLAGQETRDTKLNGAIFRNLMMIGASFRNVALPHSTFEDINFAHATFFNVNLSNVIIDWCVIDGMKIMGIEVQPLIDAELKRRRASDAN